MWKGKRPWSLPRRIKLGSWKRQRWMGKTLTRVFKNLLKVCENFQVEFWSKYSDNENDLNNKFFLIIKEIYNVIKQTQAPAENSAAKEDK